MRAVLGRPGRLAGTALGFLGAIIRESGRAGAERLPTRIILLIIRAMSIAESLERIQSWGAARGLSLRLRPPATSEAIAKTEEAWGLPFPADYRELLLIADGQEDEPEFPWLFECEPLAPLARIIEQIAELKELAEEFPAVGPDTNDGFVVSTIYHARRLPICGTPYFDGDTGYLDLAPGHAGTAGQIITLVTECDFVVLGTSLAHSLERYADALDDGTLQWVPQEQTLVVEGHAEGWKHGIHEFALA